MNQVDQSGKGPVRKLGRGLSALLGNPVQIQVPQAHAPRAAQTNALRVDDPVVGTPRPTGGAEITTVAPPALIVDMEAERFASPSPTIAKHSGLRDLPIEQIIPNRRQPRTDFDESSLQALAVSIKQAGLMQPIMVRPTQSGFELVAGERRWRAAKLLGLPTIPALVRDLTDQSAAELALIENIQREDLNPMERALALRRLAMDFGMTHQQIAERVGLDRASVSNLLRLSELDHATADLVRSGRLTQGHAKALLAIGELGERAELAAKSVAQDWSVRELERQVQHAQRPKGIQADSVQVSSESELTARDANVADLERQLTEHLGTRVALQLGRKKGSGRLVLEFYNLDQFDGLMQKMGFGGRV